MCLLTETRALSAEGEKRALVGNLTMPSVEITRECPLACPGCYAYNDGHLGDAGTLRRLSDYQGPMLVERFFRLMDAHKPLHVSIVGGEPLVWFRELNEILPRLSARGIYAQVVTSAVRPIPEEWRGLRNLEISVSIDGLRPEHDVRRAPATYERIQKHIAGHQITVHCTVTRQQVRRLGYLEEFVDLWSRNTAVHKILVSLYTPQLGEVSAERLEPEDREVVVADLLRLRARFPKLHMPKELIAVYADPPASPDDCLFAKMTTCVSADLSTRITPCQFGGEPDCVNCGCVASAGLGAISRHRLPGGLSVGAVFDASRRVGNVFGRVTTVDAATDAKRCRSRPGTSRAKQLVAQLSDGTSACCRTVRVALFRLSGE